jgi:glycosyltransferase involved in cell wall biosynthesis
MRQLVGKDTADRVTLVPNGVRRDFFDVARNPESRTFVFIAELSSEYASIADWLVREVWPSVNDVIDGAKLLIVGKGASVALTAAIARAPNIEHVAFVNDLRMVYADAAAAICPVFKGYGLINKALEAMASGVPVIGGAAAFNGMKGFEAGVHGVVCRPRSSSDFVAAISNLVVNRELATQLGSAGRTLVAGQFQWRDAISSIARLIEM